MYKLVQGMNVVLRMADNTFIPLDPANGSDYAGYLAWLDEGNTPLPADGLPTPAVRTVSAAQGGIALIRAGLMEAVQAAANAEDTPAEVKWAFDKATEWSRDSAAFNYLADKAGISEATKDDLFAEASTIMA